MLDLAIQDRVQSAEAGQDLCTNLNKNASTNGSLQLK